MLGSRPIDTSIDHIVQFDQNFGLAFADHARYHRLTRKVIYLIVTRPNFTFIVSLLSRYMQTPH